MSEAERTTLFLKWAKAKMPDETFAFEAKICKGASLPFSAVKPHQVANLRRTHGSVLNYKIGDHGFDQKPFDGFQLANVNAYVVIFWYEKPGDRRFSMIPVDVWEFEEAQSVRKSLTLKHASEICPLLTL